MAAAATTNFGPGRTRTSNHSLIRRGCYPAYKAGVFPITPRARLAPGRTCTPNLRVRSAACCIAPRRPKNKSPMLLLRAWGSRLRLAQIFRYIGAPMPWVMLLPGSAESRGRPNKSHDPSAVGRMTGQRRILSAVFLRSCMEVILSLNKKATLEFALFSRGPP